MTNIKTQPKVWLLYLTFAITTFLLSACMTMPFDSGAIVTQEMDFTDFDEVEISDAFVVEITQGDDYQVIIEVDESSLPYLDVNQQGESVHIGLVPTPFFFFWNINLRNALRAEITMPNLVGLEAHDASQVTVSGFRTDEEARFELSDASQLQGEIETGDTRISASDASKIDLEGNRQDVEIEVSDASNIQLVGEGENVTVHATDASRVDLSEFPVEEATVEARDASNVTVNVSGRFDAEASDGSRIVYYGDPTIGNTNSSDGSSITARQR